MATGRKSRETVTPTPPAERGGGQATQARAGEILYGLGFSQEDMNQPFREFSGGWRFRLIRAQALMAPTVLLLLDEPVAGMNLEETEDMARYILEVNRELKLSVILVEHDMAMVMDVADRVMALDYGRTIAIGEPAYIQTNPQVIAAYLGE